ncbi:MAG: methionyl-tRNA formyltransferase [bacterium]|nr:methionyl-tRNA formyltransferase [bacterium]
MKSVFFGSDESSLSLIEILKNKTELSFVVTRPPKPSGRGMDLKSDVVKIFCDSLNIICFEAMDVDLDGIDVVFLHSFGKKIPNDLLYKPKHGFFNIHFSLLPKYRGPCPIEYAILNGEKTSGVTIFKMNEKIDAGDILLQEEVYIHGKDYVQVEKLMIEKATKMLLDAIEIISKGLYRLTPQLGEVSYTKKIKKENGLISFFNMTSDEIYLKYLAFKKWPKVFTKFKGKYVILEELIKIEGSYQPGMIINTKPLIVGCKLGAVLIKDLRMEGKKTIKGEDFSNGYRIKIGDLWQG